MSEDSTSVGVPGSGWAELRPVDRALERVSLRQPPQALMQHS